MRMHFCNCHVRDITIILEEGNLPQPRCSRCNMLVPWRELKDRHNAIAMCKKGAERNRRRMAEAELRDSTERDFGAYGKLLEMVSTCKYLGHVMTAGDDDW